MATPLELRNEHGYVLATLLGGYFVHHFWMAFKVVNARKKYGVKYPALYAPAGHKNENEFNCVQRAHQNSLENLPTFYALLLTAGMRFPISASVAGVIYLLGRMAYVKGYATGDPAKRMKGSFQYIGHFGLVGMVARWAYELLSPLVL